VIGNINVGDNEKMKVKN